MTVVATDFDLLALIHEERENNPSPDPHVIAAAVLAQVPDDHLRDALAYCLPAVVRLSGPRLSGSATPLGAPTRSRKVDLQKWYFATLNKPLEVGDDEREWKFLRDCTRDDVLRAAAYRRNLAAANLVQAERLETLAEKMRVHRAVTAADLDAGLLAEALR